jgi:hypothetical protein
VTSPEEDADFQAYLAEQRHRLVVHPFQLRTAGEPMYYDGPVNHQAVAGSDGDLPVPVDGIEVHRRASAPAP